MMNTIHNERFGVSQDKVKCVFFRIQGIIQLIGGMYFALR